MKNNFQCIIGFIAFLVINSVSAYAQINKKKIFFLADTVNIDKNNRMVEIGEEGPFSYYSLLCRCVAPYHQLPSFAFRTREAKIEITPVKPEVPYISISELLDLLKQHGNNFDDHFTIQIVEQLPDKKYKIADKIMFIKQRKNFTVN